MKKTQLKDAVRNIRKNFVSWLAISFVTMICCGVFFGTLFYVDSMNRVSTAFARDTNYEDINILAPSGLKEDEIARLEDTEGIAGAEGSFQIADSLLKAGETKVRLQIVSLTERISVPQVLEGELPQAADECALPDQTMKEYGIRIGDTVSLYAGGDAPEGLLVYETYTVAARVRHPDCLYTVDSDIAFLPPSAFSAEVTGGNYTYIRVDADIPDSVMLLDESYKGLLLPVKERLAADLEAVGRDHDRELRGAAQEKLDQSRADAGEELAAARKQLEDARAELEAQEAQLQQMEAAGMDAAEARAGLEKARAELEGNEKDFETRKAEAEAGFEKAQQEIDGMKESAYMLVPRTQLQGFILLHENITILQSLAIVFAVIFTGIGAIVVFSTITILIEGQRSQIGAMKAIGFRNREIVARYLIYGVLAVAFGMVLSLGLEMFLQLLMHKEIGPMFCVGPENLAFDGGVFALLFAAEVLVASAVTVLVTVKRAVKTSAVELMNNTPARKNRGTASASGKRSSLYSRLILRNIRMDLARVICSTVIIAGSALMIGVGFTLNGALNNMMKTSAARVNHYDIEAVRGADSSDGDFPALEAWLRAEGLAFAVTEKRTAMYKAGDFEEAVTVVTGSAAVFPDYIETAAMQGSPLALPGEDGVLVCSRISENVKIGEGDSVVLYDAGFAPHTLAVSGVFRNYYGSLLILSEDGFREVFGREPAANTFLIRLGEGQDRDAAAARIRAEHPEFDLSFPDEMPKTYQGLTRMFTVLVVVMTGLSIAMSVCVLLNLVNIFVRCRKNELIVMRVVGFSHQQDIGYLLKEAVATTLAGIAGGVLAGCLMTEFLVRMVEGTETMFVRTVSPAAWLLAVLLEGAFALLINLFAFRRVRKFQLTDITQ